MDQHCFKIVNANRLDKRSYVSFYFEDKRIREYCGKRLKLDIFQSFKKCCGENQVIAKAQSGVDKSSEGRSLSGGA